MADAPNFSKLVPGFDFLQGLAKNAGAALPGMGQWVAPTLDPAELDKRIGELRTVQFWLEQNARMLGTTIQALEVQRMTLGTLQTMNVQMDDLREALTIRPPGATASKKAAAADQADAKPADKPKARPAAGNGAPPVVDPMQWWGALTQQFSELAANAMKQGSAGAAQRMTEALARQGMEAVEQTMKQAMPGGLSPDKGKKTAKATTAAAKPADAKTAKSAKTAKRGKPAKP